jgi:hypothetical protein
MPTIKFRSRTVAPLTVNETDIIDVLNENTLEIEQIPVTEAKGRKYMRKLNVKNYLDHDSDLVKIGYLSTMKLNEKGNLIVKMPKKNNEIRAFFNYYGNKASFELDFNIYKDMCSKYVDRAPNKSDIFNLPSIFNRDEFCAFFCGYASATIYSKVTRTGYLSLPYNVTSKFMGLDVNGFLDLSFDFFSCNTVLEDDRIFLQKLDELWFFIENISVIGEDKLQDIIDLCKLKSPVISSITK